MSKTIPNFILLTNSSPFVCSFIYQCEGQCFFIPCASIKFRAYEKHYYLSDHYCPASAHCTKYEFTDASYYQPYSWLS